MKYYFYNFRKKMYNYDLDKDISFEGSRSYEILQYQITYTEKGTGLRIRLTVVKRFWLTTSSLIFKLG